MMLHGALNTKLKVLVYSSNTEAVREASLVPNLDWGGDDCLGCDLGMGALHRIPAERAAPGVAQFPNAPVRAEGMGPQPQFGQALDPAAGMPLLPACASASPPCGAIPNANAGYPAAAQAYAAAASSTAD